MARWARPRPPRRPRLEHIYRQLLAGSKVELIEGHARIEGPNRGARRRAHRHRAASAAGHRRRAGARQHPRHRSCPDQRRTARPEGAAEACRGDRWRLHRGRVRQYPGAPGRAGVRCSTAPSCRCAVSTKTCARAPLPRCSKPVSSLHPAPRRREVQRAGDDWLLIAADERMRDFPFVLNATGRRPNTRGPRPATTSASQ